MRLVLIGPGEAIFGLLGALGQARKGVQCLLVTLHRARPSPYPTPYLHDEGESATDHQDDEQRLHQCSLRRSSAPPPGYGTHDPFWWLGVPSGWDVPAGTPVKKDSMRSSMPPVRSALVLALGSPASIALGFVAGSVPFSNLVAKRRAGVDLRNVGSGTVSGSGLYEVAGAGPLVIVGLFELAKGAIAPLLAGRRHPFTGALAGAAAVAGHNWSPFLGGAGGRGISPAIGALLVTAPAGSGVLLAGLALGKLAGETALGSFIADLLLVPVAASVHGRNGGLAALAVLAPIVAKRLMGNGPPLRPIPNVYLVRLVFDRDTREKPSADALKEADGLKEPCPREDTN